jgi:putative acetyltransferase
VTPFLRAYAAPDRDELTRLIVTTLAEFGFAPDMGGLDADLAAIAERYAPPRGTFVIAELEGHVVGSVAVRERIASDTGVCELKRLYVSPLARGHGLGQRLYEHAESFARAAGYRRIWLDSSRRFTAARRLYERNGFVLLEELDNDWEDNVYEKTLRTGVSSDDAEVTRGRRRGPRLT